MRTKLRLTVLHKYLVVFFIDLPPNLGKMVICNLKNTIFFKYLQILISVI
jgi:hypothetical protein